MSLHLQEGQRRPGGRQCMMGLAGGQAARLQHSVVTTKWTGAELEWFAISAAGSKPQPAKNTSMTAVALAVALAAQSQLGRRHS